MYIENWASEEHDRLIEILKKTKPFIKGMGDFLHDDSIPAEDIEKYINRGELEKLTDALKNLKAEVEKAHFEKIAEGGADAILANAKEQMPLIIKDAYKQATQGAEDPALGADASFKFTPQDAANILLTELSLHINALTENKKALNEIIKSITNEIDRNENIDGKAPVDLKILLSNIINGKEQTHPLFSEPLNISFDKNYVTYNGKIVDVLASLSNRNITKSDYSNKFFIKSTQEKYNVEIFNFDEQKGNLGINSHKLLKMGIAKFTQLNSKEQNKIIDEISIPFYEYARKLGHEIDECPTDTQEAAQKERNRAKEAIKTARKRISQDLNILFSLQASWVEKIKGKEENFEDVRIIYKKGIKDGYITMSFSPTFAEYLKTLPISYYHTGLLGISAKSGTAYRIGLKMTEHFSIVNNQIQNTANRLKVSTLLEKTQLPTYEVLQNEGNARQWETRIKEPFESALDTLTGKVLSDWKYTKSKGEPLTDEEAENITDYKTFSNLLIQFEILDPPDLTDHIEKKKAEKAAAGIKKKKSGRKKKTT